MVTLPQQYSNPDAIRDQKSVVGKTATSKISAGEEILGNKLLASTDKASRLAYSIPEGKRALAIPVNDISGVAGYLKVGNRVDIIATLDLGMLDSSGKEQSTPVSVLCLQDIEILAIGKNPEANVQKNSTGVNTLTLAVSIQEAQPLVLASERGSLRLLLRTPADHSRVQPQPYRIQDFSK